MAQSDASSKHPAPSLPGPNTEGLDPRDIPEALRTPAEQAQVLLLNQQAPERAAEDLHFNTLLAQALLPHSDDAEQDEPSPDFQKKLMARVHADRAQPTAQATQPATARPAESKGSSPTAGATGALGSRDTARRRANPSPPSQIVFGSYYRRLAPALGAFVVLMLVFAVRPWRSEPDAESPIRTRGDGLLPLQLDLQATVERAGGQLEPALEGLSFGRDDGLIFRYEVAGGHFFALLERDPQGQVKVLYQETVPEIASAERAAGEPTLRQISDSEGNALRYTPDGPAGAYAFMAILSRAALTLTPELLKELEPHWSLPTAAGLEAAPPKDAGYQLEVLHTHYLTSAPLPQSTPDRGAR